MRISDAAGDFAGTARRLAGLAGVAFGWTPETFWHATPEELAALTDAASGGQARAAPPLDRAALRELEERLRNG